MWTAEDRERYKEDGRRYPSDLTDAEWGLVRSLFEHYATLTRDHRVMDEGCLYLAGEGCRWRSLPKDFGPGRIQGRRPRAKRNGSSEADPLVFAKLREQRLERGEEAEALPRRQVVAEDDLLQLGVAHGVEVEVPRQVAAEPPVRVLGRALLPGRVRVADPGRHGAGARQQAVPGERGVVVEGDRGPQPRVEPAEHRHQHRHGLGRGLAGQPGREHEPGLPLLEDEHRPGPLADQQVAFSGRPRRAATAWGRSWTEVRLSDDGS